MLRRLCRDDAFLHGGKRFRPSFISVIETAATVTAIVGIAISPIRADTIDLEMHEALHLSNLAIGAGCFSIVAGILQLFCQTLDVRPAKRGRTRTVLNVRKWSFRSTAPGVVMIAIGALLLGGLSI